MPLLWTNKNRVNRVFQIVADLHSSKRSSSFAVQTGFPTSLIDLLIKNRTRFTNPKSNKPFQTQTSDPPPSETPSFNDCKVDCAEPDHTESQNSTQLITDEENLNVNDDVVLNSDQGVSRVGKSNDGSGSKSVLGIFLMMFITVVSIASFEKLTVGVTVSALVLLFLEYAVLCSKPKEEIKVVLTDSLSFEEIKVVGVSSEDTSSCDGVKLDCVKEDKKLECSEKVVDSCKVSLHENKVNNSVKFKSMLKKLLGQKFQRSSRKEEKEECKVESRSGEDGCSNNFEKYFELKEEVVVVDSASKSPLLLNVKPEDMRVTSEVKRVDSVGNSDYMLLFGRNS